MKRIYIILIAALALLLAFTAAAAADTVIDKVAITVTAPAAGAKASLAAQVSAVGCTFQDMIWGDESTMDFLEEGDIFQEDHAYSTTVMLQAEQGYVFDEEKTAFTINGEKASIFMLNKDSAGVYVIFTNLLKERKLIEKVDITLTAPAVGQTPNFSATVKSDGCTFAALDWVDNTANRLLEENDAFIAGHEYAVYVALSPNDGYGFKIGETAFTINGKTAEGAMLTVIMAEAGYVYDALAADDGFTGFKQQDGGLYYFKDGKVDATADGLVLDGVNNVFYFCAAGRVQTQHTGIAMYGGQFFYVVGGALDVNKAGLITYDGERFIIAAGRILIEYNGLIQDPNSGKWYYVAAGQVVNYTGLALYDGAWFYVINGELGVNFTGEVEYDGAKFNVVNGMLVA